MLHFPHYLIHLVADLKSSLPNSSWWEFYGAGALEWDKLPRKYTSIKLPQTISQSGLKVTWIGLLLTCILHYYMGGLIILSTYYTPLHIKDLKPYKVTVIFYFVPRYSTSNHVHYTATLL